MIQLLQIASGIAWSIAAVLFAPAVIRIWRAPYRGPARPDPIDVLVSPLAFIALVQVGFVIRWMLFPHAVATMGGDEILVWSGLYTLAIIAAGGSVFAWCIARRLP